MIPFGEYKPDQSSFLVNSTQYLSNVLPRADGYGPMSDLSPTTTALAAACRGFFYARKNDGSIAVFAGTSTKLYQLSNTDFTWGDVSKASGTYTTLAADDQWQFAQFNNYVFAVQINAPVQVFDLTSSTEFADLGGSPPQARYIAIVNRFVVLSGLGTSTPYRIQWSGYNATTTWTAGTNSSDFQDLPDGGIVRSVAGGEYGIITQDSAVRRMIYSPGSPVVFQIERIAEEKGIFAPLSLTRSGDRVFYASTDGFKMIAGGIPQAIGKERVDRTFFADVDTAALRLCIGASDPRSSRVYFAYKSFNGASGLFDKMLCYDWALDRWSPVTVTGEYITSLAAPGITLENLDSIDTSIENHTGTWDDISTATLAALSGINSSHKLGFFSGSALEATLDTPEQGNNGRRIRVRGFRPSTDAATCYGSVGGRERQQDSVTYSTEQALDTRGFCPANVSTRLARGRLRIPAATIWTFATGIEPEFVSEGSR